MASAISAATDALALLLSGVVFFGRATAVASSTETPPEDAKNVTAGPAKRAKHDKYYTNPEVARACARLLFETVRVADGDVIIEPSAGDGAFFDILRQRHANTRAYDLVPEAPDIVQQDFYTLTPPPLASGRVYHVAGNPPFGVNHADANAFIRHAAEFANTIAFILPIAFAKPWVQTNFPPSFHLACQRELPLDAFHYSDGTPYQVRCVWQVWVRKETPRPLLPEEVAPVGFHFAEGQEIPTHTIARTGLYAGRVAPFEHREDMGIMAFNTNWYYIVADSKEMSRRIKLAEAAMQGWDTLSTGPRSLSRREVVEIINQYTTGKHQKPPPPLVPLGV